MIKILKKNNDNDNDNNSNSNNSDDDYENNNNDFIETTEIQYILKNSKLNTIELSENKLEELMFKENKNLDLQQVLAIKVSYNVFSYLVKLNIQ